MLFSAACRVLPLDMLNHLGESHIWNENVPLLRTVQHDLGIPVLSLQPTPAFSLDTIIFLNTKQVLGHFACCANY